MIDENAVKMGEPVRIAKWGSLSEQRPFGTIYLFLSIAEGRLLYEDGPGR